jgi:hypothetical protein
MCSDWVIQDAALQSHGVSALRSNARSEHSYWQIIRQLEGHEADDGTVTLEDNGSQTPTPEAISASSRPAVEIRTSSRPVSGSIVACETPSWVRAVSAGC